MNVKNYIIVSSAIFALVAVVHLARIVAQWGMVIDGWYVPMWVSYLGVVVAGLLSFVGLRALLQIQRFLS